MNDLMKMISTLIGIIAVTFSIFFFNEKRYASQVEYFQLEQRVSLKEIKDLLKEARENMYFYQKILRNDPENEELQRKVKQYEEEVQDLKEQIRDIKK